MTFPPGPAEEGILTPLIANPNQYKFCLASLHILFLNSAQIEKGELLKWARVCGGGLEVDKIVIRNPTLILFAEN